MASRVTSPPKRQRRDSAHVPGGQKLLMAHQRRFLAQSVPRGLGVRGETKALDNLNLTLNFDTTGSVQCLNLVRAGTSFVNRIGRKIALQKIYITGDIEAQAAATSRTYCRMIVVYDSQTNGASPVWADVVKGYDQGLTTSSTVKDGVNLDNRDRFRILCDIRRDMPTTATSVSDNLPAPISSETLVTEFRNIPNFETQFKADSNPAVVGDIATGGLFVLTFGDVANGSAYFFSGTIRLRFTDN